MPIDPDKLAPDTLHEFKRRAEEILTQDFNKCSWFVLKDPRIGRLLRLWVQAVEAHGAQPRVVIPIRHPLEVAASLYRREGFPEGKSVYLWLRHTVDAIRDSRRVPRGFIFFDELMQDWRAAVKRLGSDMNVRWPKKLDSVAPMVEQFLDQQLRHHAYSGIHFRSGGLVNRLADDLYVALCKRAGGLEGLVDSIHKKLGVIERVFGPLQHDSNRKIGLVTQDRDRVAVEKGLLGQEFEDKGRHVERLEQLIASKREQYMHLEEEFTDKGRHVELLTEEVSGLQGQQGRAQAQLSELEQTLERERAAHTALVASFEDKGRHVELLTEEVSGLQGHTTLRDRQLKQAVSRLAETELASRRIDRAFKKTRIGNPKSFLKRNVISKSGLFDWEYYYSANAGLMKSFANPIDHYLANPVKPGVNPHPLFDGLWYLERNPDVAQKGINPLYHYIRFGAKERRSPHPLFDANLYLRLYPDVAASGINPLVHYVRYGGVEGRRTHWLFDATAYLKAFPELLDIGMSPLEHYCRYGVFLSFRPHRHFDPDFYLDANPDVRAAGINPLLHYLRCNAAETRDPAADFSTEAYWNAYPEVKASGENPLVHYASWADYERVVLNRVEHESPPPPSSHPYDGKQPELPPISLN
ncbi:MAG: hypothetical protein ACREA9_08075, partial [Pyrinomonadaceae bacterium]